MFSILLAVIYITFISLGLPDSILGSAWPSMYGQLDVPVSYMGIITMIISAGTIVSSINSDKLISKLGTGIVTVVSVAMTAAALFGFSISGSFYMLCFWAIPYGLGAGSVDAALNNFVALHYKSKHMSWLHCFWGVGATTGPYIMGMALTRNLPWNKGYQAIGVIQTVLVTGLVLSLPLWKNTKNRMETGDKQEDVVKQEKGMKLIDIIKIKGAKNILIAFFCYCALEASTGLWASSYLVFHKGINSETAAKWAALFYFGITGGRFISGFIADRFGDKKMVRIGQATCVLGILILFLPFGTLPSLIGLVMIGLGCAPIFPSLLHATPDNFGPEKSQAIMGVQMATAYLGTTLMPPLFGVIANYINISLYPVYLLIIIVSMIYMVEGINRAVDKERRSMHVS